MCFVGRKLKMWAIYSTNMILVKWRTFGQPRFNSTFHSVEDVELLSYMYSNRTTLISVNKTLVLKIYVSKP